MKVQEAMSEKRPIYRTSFVMAGAKFNILSTEVRIENGFFRVTPEDFKYTMTSFPNPKNNKEIIDRVSGGYIDREKCFNQDCVAVFEKIASDDPIYDKLKNTLDRITSANCDIELPPEKKIEIAG